MITPRWYQEEAILSIYNYFANGGRGNPIIALPTASGKSIIPAIFIQRVLHQWPEQRFLVMCHVKELIRQNSSKLIEVWANAPVGIHSAGLKQRDIFHPIIFGGIQSMIKHAQDFGHRDIIFIDECHLISQDESSLYLQFLAIMKMINPNVKIVGMSATPFRMGQGLLTDNGLFTDIIYDMTDVEGFNKLIEQGFLCKLIPRPTKTELDVSGVGMQNGEFIQSQLQGAVDKAEITWKALNEALEVGHNRKSWMIFASGIDHSEHIAQMLMQLGIQCAAVHSKKPAEYNDAALAAHKNLELQAIVSFSKLTTGLDHPAIDFMIDLQPTMSTVRHIQKYGRPMRPFEGKLNSLCLDFARNIPRLGCVNDPVIPRKKGDKPGEVPVKICEACGAYNHISARICCECNEPFHFQVKITAKAGTGELLKGVDVQADKKKIESDLPKLDTFPVSTVLYVKKQKIDKVSGVALNAPYIAVTYLCGPKKFVENIFPEHKGYARKLFESWWMQRHKDTPPLTSDEALRYNSLLRTPKTITVWTNKKPFPEVKSVEWNNVQTNS